MSAVRLNITIPMELIKRVDGITGPRKRSQFITEALKRRLDEMDREKLRQSMEEGYKARKEERDVVILKCRAINSHKRHDP